MLVLLVLRPSTAAAQGAASSLEELRARLTTGETVTVTDRDGRRTKGKVLDLTASGLTVFAGTKDPSRVFSVDRVAKVVRHDPLGNGALIGLAAGAAFGWGWLLTECENDEECAANFWRLTLPVGAGIGVAVGALTDAAITRTIYVARPGRPALSVVVSPTVSPYRMGVSFTTRF